MHKNICLNCTCQKYWLNFSKKKVYKKNHTLKNSHKTCNRHVTLPVHQSCSHPGSVYLGGS